MKFLTTISELPAKLWGELVEWRRGRSKPPGVLLWIPLVLGVAFLLYCLVRDWSVLTMSAVPEGMEEPSLFKYKAGVVLGILTKTFWLMLLTALPVLFYFALLGIGSLPIAVLAAFCAALAALLVANDVHANWEGAKNSFLGEDSSVSAYLLKLFLLAVLVLSPAPLLWAYRRSGILVRYVSRSLLGPFLLCTLGFTAIIIIFDLADNLPDFAAKKNGTPLPVVLRFYLVMIPKMMVEVLPVGLLLSVLYTLGRLSQHNEIISILGSGRSLLRVLVPCFTIGLLTSAACFVLNYHWAPKADGIQDSMIKAIREGEEQVANRVVKQLYRNREDHRSWYIGSLPFDLGPDKEKMKSISIIQEDGTGRRTEEWSAKQALWFPASATTEPYWKLYQLRHIKYGENPEDSIITDYFTKPEDKLIIPDLKETPWMIFSATLDPQYMSVPELTNYIQTNRAQPKSQLAPFHAWKHYRMANPWRCLVIVMLSAPLAIVFSRRGLLGGVAAAIALFAAMFFMDDLFLALAQGDKINPFISAWITNIVFAIVGALLLLMKTRNREFKMSNPLSLFRDPAPAKN